MPYTLQITFTGLCLHLVQKDRKRLAVLQPDARPKSFNDTYFDHEDGTQGIRHSGYLRWDLANYVAAIAPGELIPAKGAEPYYEVVHRFDRQEVKFDLPATTDTISGNMSLPQFAEIANEYNPANPGQPLPLLEPLPHLFSTVPPTPLLMRLVLEGGTLASTGSERWRFPRLFRRGKPNEYMDTFKSVVTWTRRVEEAAGLNITIADFDGSNPTVIPLKPVIDGGVIPLKIANLCSSNPLEWSDLDHRLVTENDEDFKWLYRLLQPVLSRDYTDILLDLPFPIPQKPILGGGAGVEDCFGAVLEVASIP